MASTPRRRLGEALREINAETAEDLAVPVLTCLACKT